MVSQVLLRVWYQGRALTPEFSSLTRFNLNFQEERRREGQEFSVLSSSHGVYNSSNKFSTNGHGLQVAAHSQFQNPGGIEDRQIPLISANNPCGGLPRFHVDLLPAVKGMVVQLKGDEFWHMTRVLRLNLNDRVELFDGKGGIVEASLVQIRNTSVELAAVRTCQVLPPTSPHWHVAAAFGTLKGGRGDWLVEKCTELGAQRLTPLLTQRSPAIPGQRTDRWQRMSIAATKQCQRLHVLEVREPIGVQSLLPEVAKANVTFLATAGATPLVEAMTGVPKHLEGGLLLIGPEGDFTGEEIQMLVEAGAVPVGLGQCRLRVETAAIAMLATVMLMSDNHQTYARTS
ncbi:unnamed protein product [Sphagnum troendelagicum]|uniref:16S rRNA (uracil(1498)-N(3))-methyltransferase n=1 Tax=Sphagnum troendelagicum TaxID=128251 RepID=A0ABP0UGM4_9BRYO